MADFLPIPASMLAYDVSGDLGPLTLYRSKNGTTVAFPRSPPKRPPTPAQLTQRKRFQDAMLAWNALTVEQQRAYEHATLVLSLPLTGLNLWIHFCLVHDLTALHTIELQSRTTLTEPPQL